MGSVGRPVIEVSDFPAFPFLPPGTEQNGHQIQHAYTYWEGLGSCKLGSVKITLPILINAVFSKALTALEIFIKFNASLRTLKTNLPSQFHYQEKIK